MCERVAVMIVVEVVCWLICATAGSTTAIQDTISYAVYKVILKMPLRLQINLFCFMLCISCYLNGQNFNRKKRLKSKIFCPALIIFKARINKASHLPVSRLGIFL